MRVTRRRPAPRRTDAQRPGPPRPPAGAPGHAPAAVPPPGVPRLTADGGAQHLPWWGQWPCYLLGAGLVVLGARNIAADAHGYTPPREVLSWLVKVVLVHDLVVAPVMFGLGWLGRRWLPARVRVTAAAALLASASLAALAYPLVRGFGRDPNLPSALPQNYAQGLLVSLGVVWAVAAGAVLVTSRPGRARRPRRG